MGFWFGNFQDEKGGEKSSGTLPPGVQSSPPGLGAH